MHITANSFFTETFDIQQSLKPIAIAKQPFLSQNKAH
jgi:hypothetical protein